MILDIGCKAGESLSCLNNGKCLPNGVCECSIGYSGSRCEDCELNSSVYIYSIHIYYLTKIKDVIMVDYGHALMEVHAI